MSETAVADLPKLLLADEVAHRAGVQKATIKIYTAASRRKAAAGPLGLEDFPLPLAEHYQPNPKGGPKLPAWPEPVIETWLDNRRPPGGSAAQAAHTAKRGES